MIEASSTILDPWTYLQQQANSLLVPEFLDGEERPCEETDFIDYKPLLEDALFNLSAFITKQSLSVDCIPSKQCTVTLLLLCGEHSSPNCWTTADTLKASVDIETSLCKLLSVDNIKALLKIQNIFKQCLINLSIKLQKDKWRLYPGAVASFKWLLFNVEMPTLGENLPFVFPATLVIIDDFESDNKALGLKMMHHIIANVTRAELKRHQYDDVLFDVLLRLLYFRQETIIVPSISCVSSLLIKVDVLHVQTLEMSRFDKALEVVLNQMEMEQRLTIRYAYAEALAMLIKVGRLSLLRWSNRLFRIFAEYLELEDNSKGQTQLYTLQSLHWFLQQTWPRTKSYVRTALSCLLRLLRELTQQESSLIVPPHVKSQLFVMIEQCLKQLSLVALPECQHHLKGSKLLPFGPKFHEILSKCIASPS